MDKVIMKLKVFAEWFLEWFVFITTGVLIICAINFSLFSDSSYIPRSTLSHILLSAFLTAAVTAFFCLLEPVKKSSRVICFFLHFCCLLGIMLVCGIRFGWIDFESFGMIRMGVSVVVVYLFVIAVYYILDKHWAEQINHRLKEKYSDEVDQGTFVTKMRQ